VSGLVAAGAASADLVGPAAHPWTFAMAGRAQPGSPTLISSVTLSTASATLAGVFLRLRVHQVAVRSSNGDVIDLAGARLEMLPDLAEGTDEMMVCFASPFALIRPKEGRTKTAFVESLDDVDVDAALRRGLERRFGRTLRLSFHIDRLSLASDVTRRLVRLRRLPDGRPLFVPAFAVPMTLRGDPADLRAAYLAGLGAKTHAGLGCPIPVQ
jgi:hypothetical protein